jgi:hypothetical protein
MHILEKNQPKLHFRWLCFNHAPAAMRLLEKKLEKLENIDWRLLCLNPSAIHLIEKNLDKIGWKCLSENPAAIHLLEKNQDKIDWKWLSKNPAAIHLLEKNLDKVDWEYISGNPEIFEYDYASMSRPFTEELMKNRFHPDNIDKFEDWGH